SPSTTATGPATARWAAPSSATATGSPARRCRTGRRTSPRTWRWTPWAPTSSAPSARSSATSASTAVAHRSGSRARTPPATSRRSSGPRTRAGSPARGSATSSGRPGASPPPTGEASLRDGRLLDLLPRSEHLEEAPGDARLGGGARVEAVHVDALRGAAHRGQDGREVEVAHVVVLGPLRHLVPVVRPRRDTRPPPWREPADEEDREIGRAHV